MQTATKPPTTDRAYGHSASALLLTISLLWCLYWFLHTRGYWEDDAWIHLEFARSLARGQGFAFNGRIVPGDTAPLWVLLLVAAHALLPQWLAAGKLLTALGAAFGLAGVYAFARRIARELLPGHSYDVFAAAMVLLVATNPYTCYWIFSGMEPIAAAGLACWAVLAATCERPTALSFLAGCLLTGLGPTLRPEMFFLAVLLAIPLYRQWRSLHAPPAVKIGCAVAGIVLLTGPLLAWLLYSVHAFGHLLPNTNAAKRAAPDKSVLRRLATIYGVGLPLILGAAAVAAVHLALHPTAVFRSARKAFSAAMANTSRPQEAPLSSMGTAVRTLPLCGWLFVLWTAAAALFYLANHTYIQTRYILVSAPALMVIIIALALCRWPRVGRSCYAAALIAGTAVSLIVVIPLIRNKSENCGATQQVAHFLRDQLPPDTPVAVYGIGQIAFESEHPIIDTGGITRPGAIPYLNAPLESMAHWAESEGAQYYISSDAPDAGSVPIFTVKTPFIGWAFRRSRYSESAPVSVWRLPARAAGASDVSAIQP